MDTAWAEGLTSYIVRLAGAHSVSPKRLLRRVFAAVQPEIANVVECGSFFTCGAKGVDGMGLYADLFSRAAMDLTSARDLHLLTLQPLQHLLPENCKGFLAQHPRWCPRCLGEMGTSRQEAYRPLIWSFSLYRYCSVHRCRLEERCPECDKHQLFLPKYPSLGFCSHCQARLGGEGECGVQVNSDELWVSQAIEGVVANLRNLEGLATRERFLAFLGAAIQAIGQGRVRFCRETGLDRTMVRRWFIAHRPSFPQWLAVSYGLGIWPWRCFAGIGEEIGGPLRQRPSNLAGHGQRPHLSRSEQAELQNRLDRIAADPADTASLSAVACRLQLDMGTLKYWASEPCAKIREKHANTVRLQGARRRAEDVCKLEAIVRGLAAEGLYPSTRKVNVALRKQGRSLAQPELRSAYRKAVSNTVKGPESGCEKCYKPHG